MKTAAKRLTKADLVRELRAAHANARRWERDAKRLAHVAASLKAELDRIQRVRDKLKTGGVV